MSENNETKPDTGALPGVGSTVWFGSSGDPMQNFRLIVKERSDVTISGKVEEVTAWSGDNEAIEFELYLTFYMKWDGCCHVWFGEEEDGKQDGYLHLCGADSWERHIRLMADLYSWAETAIPMELDVSGTFTPNNSDQITPRSGVV